MIKEEKTLEKYVKKTRPKHTIILLNHAYYKNYFQLSAPITKNVKNL